MIFMISQIVSDNNQSQIRIDFDDFADRTDNN